MKYRTGFVSNSSSSSFVVVGFEVPRDQFTDEDYLRSLFGVESKPHTEADEFDVWEQLDACQEDQGVTVATDEDQGAAKGRALIGVTVAVWGSDEDRADQIDHDIETLVEKASELRAKLGVAETVPIRLVCGTRLS